MQIKGNYAEAEEHHEKGGMIGRLMQRYWGNGGTPNGKLMQRYWGNGGTPNGRLMQWCRGNSGTPNVLNFVMVLFSVHDSI
jgi:hypothetical protein